MFHARVLSQKYFFFFFSPPFFFDALTPIWLENERIWVDLRPLLARMFECSFKDAFFYAC